MSKRLTIRVSEQLACRARDAAKKDKTSVSKLVGRMLEEEMRRQNQYRETYDRVKKIEPAQTRKARGLRPSAG